MCKNCLKGLQSNKKTTNVNFCLMNHFFTVSLAQARFSKTNIDTAGLNGCTVHTLPISRPTAAKYWRIKNLRNHKKITVLKQISKTRKHSESVNLHQVWVLLKVIFHTKITSEELPNLAKIKIRFGKPTPNCYNWKIFSMGFWPWTLTLTSQKFTVKFERLCQISRKLNFYFSRNHNNQSINLSMNEWMSQSIKPSICKAPLTQRRLYE